jgi:hypothetical protein
MRLILLGAAALLASCAGGMPMYDTEDDVSDNCARVVGVASNSALGTDRAKVIEGCKAAANQVGGNALVLTAFFEKAEADGEGWYARCMAIAYKCQ